MGEFTKDKFPGEFMDSWRSAVGAAGFDKVDLANPLAYVMAPKEESEVAIIKRASQATMDLFNKFLKEQIMQIIDADKVRFLY